MGLFPGVLAAGTISDKFGRKRTIIVVALMARISKFNIHSCVLGRFIPIKNSFIKLYKKFLNPTHSVSCSCFDKIFGSVQCRIVHHWQNFDEWLRTWRFGHSLGFQSSNFLFYDYQKNLINKQSFKCY